MVQTPLHIVTSSLQLTLVTALFKSFSTRARAPVWLTFIAAAALATEVASQPSADPVFSVIPVQGNVFMIHGARSNIAAQVGPQGVVLVDAGPAEMADDVVAALKTITAEPIRYIINTGPSPDHIGGNERVAAAGVSLFERGGRNAQSVDFTNDGAASIVGPENLLLRMSEADYPIAAQPTEAFVLGESKNLFLNDEPIQVFYQPAAHSDSDSVVHFRRSDVVATGAILDMTRFPIIDLVRGGSIQGEIDALNRLVRLVVPSIPLPYIEGGTKVIPSRGRLAEQAEIVEYRDMVTIIRDRVQALIDDGATLDAVQEANPANGFVGRFGTDPDWSASMFVEAVYLSLLAER